MLRSFNLRTLSHCFLASKFSLLVACVALAVLQGDVTYGSVTVSYQKPDNAPQGPIRDYLRIETSSGESHSEVLASLDMPSAGIGLGHLLLDHDLYIANGKSLALAEASGSDAVTVAVNILTSDDLSLLNVGNLNGLGYVSARSRIGLSQDHSLIFSVDSPTGELSIEMQHPVENLYGDQGVYGLLLRSVSTGLSQSQLDGISVDAVEVVFSTRDGSGFFTVSGVSIPEPSSALLVGFAFSSVLWRRRRRV